jgi:hypothetical protein
MDFRTMTGAGLAQAKRLIAGLRLPMPQVRMRPDPHGPRIDRRGTLRASLRSGADVIPLRRRAHRREHLPLAVLCDISGSMSRYSRMFLHFLHAVTNDRDAGAHIAARHAPLPASCTGKGKRPVEGTRRQDRLDCGDGVPTLRHATSRATTAKTPPQPA